MPIPEAWQGRPRYLVQPDFRPELSSRSQHHVAAHRQRHSQAGRFAESLLRNRGGEVPSPISTARFARRHRTANLASRACSFERDPSSAARNHSEVDGLDEFPSSSIRARWPYLWAARPRRRDVLRGRLTPSTGLDADHARPYDGLRIRLRRLLAPHGPARGDSRYGRYGRAGSLHGRLPPSPPP